jgi:hypothetical protein
MAVAGLATGTVIGLLASLVLRIGMGGVLKDAGLGTLGFLAGFIGCVFLPWPENTITYYVGDTLVTSTASRFQHPYWAGFVVAALLPLLHEFFRLRRLRLST